MGNNVGVFGRVTKRIKEDVTVVKDKKLLFRDSGIFIQSSADGKLLISSDGSGADDITLTGNVTITNDLTISGSFSYGAVTATSLNVTGATTLDGAVTLGDAKADVITVKGDLSCDGTQNPVFDYSSSTGTFKTSTGINTIGGTVSVSADKNLACVAGTTAVDWSLGTGTFDSPTGTNQLNGDVSIASGKNFDMSAGAGTFATGTGAVTLAGDVTISGSKTLSTGTGLTTLGGDLQIDGNNIVDAGGSSGITFDGAGNTSIDGNLAVVGTFTFDDAEVTGNFDIQGTNLQATTGTLNISKSGSTTTVKGIFNVDEAAVFDTTVGVLGDLTVGGATNLGDAKADTVTILGDIASSGVQNPVIDFSASSGAFDTSSGTNQLNGHVSIASGKNFDMSAGAGTFATGTGAVSLDGDVTVAVNKDVVTSGSGYFQGVNAQLTNIKAHDGTACLDITDSTGALGIAGSVTIAANKNISCAAGSSAIDFSVGTGAFDSPTGTNQLNGDVSIASGKNFDMSAGAGTLASGTGQVDLLGSVVLATTKAFTSGTGTAIGGVFTIYSDGAGAKSVEITPGTSIILGDNVSFAGAETLSTGTGLTTISGDVSLTGHFQAQEFVANAFNFPDTSAEWAPILSGAFMAASITAKKCWIPLNFLKIGDEIVSYKLIGDATETNALTLDCKLVSINKADPITTTDVAGGGIVQVDADGVFDVEAVLGAVETVATDKMYALEVLGTTAVADTITVMGAEVKVNRKT